MNDKDLAKMKAKLGEILEDMGIEGIDINDTESPDLGVAQVAMPDDWVTRVSNSKVEHDKNGGVATVIVLPLAWLSDFKKKVENQDPGVTAHIKHNMLWGADIVFGAVDEPIAAGLWV